MNINYNSNTYNEYNPRSLKFTLFLFPDIFKWPSISYMKTSSNKLLRNKYKGKIWNIFPDLCKATTLMG